MGRRTAGRARPAGGRWPRCGWPDSVGAADTGVGPPAARRSPAAAFDHDPQLLFDPGVPAVADHDPVAGAVGTPRRPPAGFGRRGAVNGRVAGRKPRERPGQRPLATGESGSNRRRALPGLVVRALIDQAGRFLPELVTSARRNGHTWRDIAHAWRSASPMVGYRQRRPAISRPFDALSCGRPGQRRRRPGTRRARSPAATARRRPPPVPRSTLACPHSCTAPLGVACRRQRGPMDPGGKVRGRALGDSGGVPGKLLLAEDLPPLAC